MTAFGSIYCVTNTINGRRYIGQTCGLVSTRWSVHKSEARRRPQCYFHKAIRKHGASAFTVETVAVAATREELCALEKEWVARLRTNVASIGYNLTSGGELNYERTPECRARQSQARKGRKLSASHCAAMSRARRGVKQSPEHIASRAAALRGRTPSDACRAAVADANRRRVVTPEYRAKMAAILKAANAIRWSRTRA